MMSVGVLLLVVFILRSSHSTTVGQYGFVSGSYLECLVFLFSVRLLLLLIMMIMKMMIIRVYILFACTLLQMMRCGFNLFENR